MSVLKKIFFLLFLFLNVTNSFAQKAELPKGFVYINEVVPGVEYEIRYAGSNNFLGRPVSGYKSEQAILSKPAAEALAKVQEELLEEGYCLKIFDAYRPQTAVNDFVKWARIKEDTLTKSQFYPEIDKKDLFSLGYIASRSGHSRGSTVDLTIVHEESGKALDMGGTYDFFGPVSHHGAEGISEKQAENRLFLKKIMRKHGFRHYPKEWWHYTLNWEPYPESYFDFPVK